MECSLTDTEKVSPVTGTALTACCKPLILCTRNGVTSRPLQPGSASESATAFVISLAARRLSAGDGLVGTSRVSRSVQPTGVVVVDDSQTGQRHRSGMGTRPRLVIRAEDSVPLQAHFNTIDMLPDRRDQFWETFHHTLTPLIRKSSCDIPRLDVPGRWYYREPHELCRKRSRVHQGYEVAIAGGLGRGAFVTCSYALQLYRKPPPREQQSPRLAVIDSKCPRLRVSQVFSAPH